MDGKLIAGWAETTFDDAVLFEGAFVSEVEQHEVSLVADFDLDELVFDGGVDRLVGLVSVLRLVVGVVAFFAHVVDALGVLLDLQQLGQAVL
jgi:hypothetical protein